MRGPGRTAGLPASWLESGQNPFFYVTEKGVPCRFGQGDRLFALPNPDCHRPPFPLEYLHLGSGGAFRTEGKLLLHLHGPHLLSVETIHLLAEWKVKALFRGTLICERAVMSGVQHRSNKRIGSPATPAAARRRPAWAGRLPSRQRRLMRRERTIARASSGA